MEKKLEQKDVLTFMLGGKALFTIKNSQTGNRFTYKVMVPKDKKPETSTIFFVKLLTGADNENSYKYIGHCTWTGSIWKFTHGKKSKISADAPGVVAFDYVFNKIVVAGKSLVGKSNELEVWHEGKCCRCGRTLTVPESIENGIGPECMKIMQMHAA